MRKRVNGLNFGRRRERKINVPLIKEIVVWVLEIAITVAIAYVFTYFFGVRSSVVGSSMSAQLDDGDEVLIDRFWFKFVSPKPGDVIAFLPNGNTNTHYYIKRVIAVPGDKVQVRDGEVYVNGEKYEETVSVARIEDAGVAANEIELAGDEYFVLGDNRNNSEDSRFASIGNVREDFIVGKVWFVISPREKFGLIK